MDPQFHGGDGLRIKLNLRLPSASDGGEASSSPSPSPPLSDEHNCHICSKGFSSGKALGGHMRMHSQTRNSIGPSPTTSIAGNAAVQKPQCGSCGKVFSSCKALYGHMRSHPERRRAIRPPSPPATTNPTSSSAASAVVDCSSSLQTWAVTARRGRKSTSSSAAAASSSAVSGAKEQVHEAVHDLMFLSKTENSPENSDGLNRKRRKIDELCDAVDTDSDHVGSSKRKLKIETDQEKKIFYDPKLSSDCQTLNNGSAEEEEELNCEGEMEGRKIKILKVKKIKEIGELNLSDSGTSEDHAAGNQIHRKNLIPAKEYSCNICNKAFMSHQALGGHKSSHNKTKKTLPMLLQPSSPTKETGNTETQAQEADGGSARTGGHQLVGIFNMTFITCHSIGTVMEAQTMSSGESGTQTGRRMLDFDLNELPPMDDGEGVQS